jgi:serine/threonine-protein kinase HipA
MANVETLNVLLHGDPIGTLTRLPDDRVIFSFRPAYIGDQNRATLGLSFKDHLGELITSFRPTQTRTLPYFSNMLPEGHLRTYLANQAGVNPTREFFLLWALGMDLPGAVAIRPTDLDAWPPGSDGEDELSTDANGGQENALRFSLAGVQLKFSAVRDARGGLTIPIKGVGGSWILKLPSREFVGVPENELSMMTLAKAVGIDVPPVELINIEQVENLPKEMSEERGDALAVQRFDRLADHQRVHMEDFAQVFGIYPENKYKRASYSNIAAVIAAETSNDDSAEFIRRLVFNTLIGNADMHLKNWSLFYPDRRRAALAPAYDFVSTVAYIRDSNAALNFSRTKRFAGLTESELSHLAAKAKLPRKLVIDTARETVALFHQHWNADKKHLPLAEDVTRAIEAHVKTLPIAALG